MWPSCPGQGADVNDGGTWCADFYKEKSLQKDVKNVN